jgi:hypothetical protein
MYCDVIVKYRAAKYNNYYNIISENNTTKILKGDLIKHAQDIRESK